MPLRPLSTHGSSTTQTNVLSRSRAGASEQGSAADVIAPKQSHPTYEEHRSQLNRELNHQRYNNVVREHWDGQEVKVQSNGTVRLFIASNRSALKLRASNNAASKMRLSTKRPSIQFSHEVVTLTIAGEVIYSKSVVALKEGKDGNEWTKQIEKELAKKGSAADGE